MEFVLLHERQPCCLNECNIFQIMYQIGGSDRFLVYFKNNSGNNAPKIFQVGVHFEYRLCRSNIVLQMSNLVVN